MKDHPFSEQIIAQFFRSELPAAQHQEVLKWLSSLSQEEQMSFMDVHLTGIAQDAHRDHNLTTPDFSDVEQRIYQKAAASRRLRNWTAGIAASLLPLLLFYFFNRQHERYPTVAGVAAQAVVSPQTIRIHNELNKNSIFQLPDSSTVTLYPEATVSYAAGLKGKKRELVLEGKAFFKVKHGTRPFTVKTGGLTTVVLGTSFWVDAASSSGNITVKVKTGKVGVLYGAKPAVFLLPAEKAIFNSADQSLVKVKPAAAPAHILPAPELKMTAIVFNETPLNQVVKVLAENFGVKIALASADAGGQLISLNTKGKSLISVLNEIKSQIPIDYEIKEKHITIRKTE